MKIYQNVTILFVFFMAFCANLMLSGCSTRDSRNNEDGYKKEGHKTEKSDTSMSDVEEDIGELVRQIDSTDASLRYLIMSGKTNDSSVAYENYSDSVDKIEEYGERVIEHVDSIRVQGKNYFEEWEIREDGAYVNPRIQALDHQRRADLNLAFVRISEVGMEVKDNFEAYLSDIKEIENYLSTDLTPKGIESITAVADEAITDGEVLKNSVEPVLLAIRDAKSGLSREGLAPD